MKPNGVIVYRGPSVLDGSPIIMIATGLVKTSTNAKTGDLIQTWILRDDMSPRAAIESGADSAICGACPHRGIVANGKNYKRSCYVRIDQAPRNIWTSAKRGIYPVASLDAARVLFYGRRVRLGAYGDPAAVPIYVWEWILADAAISPGYTHQWRTCDPRFAFYVMASADSTADRDAAKALGYRVFRARLASEPLAPREVICPASQEAGHKTTCDKCGACAGLRAKAKADIAIIVHGTGKRAFMERQSGFVVR